MPEIWINQHIGSEAVIRQEFRSALASDLQAEWQELQTVAVRPQARPPRRRWRVAAWSTAAAALLIGLVTVLNQPSSNAPPVDSTPDTNSTSDPSTTSAPTTSTTPTSVPGSGADVVVPLTGGQVIRPTSIVSVPAGGGPGQLSGFNSELSPLVVALPSSLLVLDEVPLSGLTGRALRFSRTGQWDRDVTIDGIVGTTPLWAGAAPNGVLFVATAGASVTVTAHRLVGDTYVVVDSASLADLSEGPLHLNAAGLAIRDRQIITIPTGLASPPPSASATVSPSREGAALARLTREDNGSSWSVELETYPASTPDAIDQSVGVYGDGVWYSASVSSDPMLTNRFIALIDSEQAVWFRLGEWSFSATDDVQLVVTRATTTGFELAVLGPPPPDLSADLLAAWPPPPDLKMDLSDTPMMLPSIPMPDGATRLEYDGERLPGTDDYVQYWLNTDTDALLEIRTRPLRANFLDGTYVSVAPWDNAFFTRTSGDYQYLELADPSGTVSLSTSGLDGPQLVDIARSLQPRGDSAGWDIGNTPESLVAVHEGWEGGGAIRVVRWSNAELDIASGSPATFATPSNSATTTRLTDIQGTQAVLFENEQWAAVSWSPVPGVTVVFVMNASGPEVVAAARSITGVDAATWKAASTDVTGQDDGCQSSFFC